MIDANAVVGRYLASWNEEDPEARKTMVAATFAADAHYIDPVMSGRGADEIAAMIGAARQQFPNHSFTLQSGPDGHGNHIRFSWTLAPAGGASVVGGTDFAVVDDDGRVTSVVGFLDSID
jgi:hypothetical protein